MEIKPLNQRFRLSISLDNIKQHKGLILTLVAVVGLVSLYVGYPIFVFKESPNISYSNIGQINVTTDQPVGTTRYIRGVKWGFESVIPNACNKDHVFDLKEGVFLSVCKYKEKVVLDLRKFIGSAQDGITPTKIGLGLNVIQWNRLSKNIIIINELISQLS